jgi:hypothetical protein
MWAFQGTSETERFRRTARQPYGTRLADKLLYLSPSTWIGTASYAKIDWQWKKFWLSLSGILIPAACWRLCLEDEKVPRLKDRSDVSLSSSIQKVCNSLFSGRTQLRQLCSGLLFPVWSLGCAWVGSEGLRKVVYQMRQWSTAIQSPARPDAWKLLADRIAMERAYRSRRYDVYLPVEASDDSGTTPGPKEAILLIPGFGVEHTAYAGVAAGLSDRGFLVVVVSAEPLRVPWMNLGCGAVRMRHIQGQVTRKYPSVKSWSLVGHSMGSFTATHLAPELDIHRIVFWASAPLAWLLNPKLLSAGVRILVIQVSNDPIVELMIPDKDKQKALTKQYYEILPADTTVRVIEGGTHGGFASYKSKNISETQSISLEKQFETTVDWTAEFVNQASSKT